MLIRVMYADGKFDMVKPHMLDDLIEEKKLTSFMRSGGWAVVNRDAIRGSRSPEDYSGPERRTH